MPEDAGSSGRRQRWFRIWLLLGGIVAGLLVGEGAVRLRLISPNRQIIRGHGLRSIGGMPVWLNDPVRENLRCAQEHPERTRVAFFGNSVTFGPQVQASDIFTAVLEQRLNALRPKPGFCVLNFAEPGFHYDEEYAIATEAIARYRPTVALIQDGPRSRGMAIGPNFRRDWAPAACNPWKYKIVGDSAYEVNGLLVRHDGYPGLPYVPDGVNRFLFQRSQLYQYLTLAHGEREPLHESHGDYLTCREDQMLQFAALAKSYGAMPAFYIAADLSYALNQMQPDESVLNEPLVDFGLERHLPTYQMRRMIPDLNNEAVRLDDWHFNAEGHRVLGERLVPVILGLLDGKPVPPRGSFTH